MRSADCLFGRHLRHDLSGPSALAWHGDGFALDTHRQFRSLGHHRLRRRLDHRAERRRQRVEGQRDLRLVVVVGAIAICLGGARLLHTGPIIALIAVLARCALRTILTRLALVALLLGHAILLRAVLLLATVLLLTVLLLTVLLLRTIVTWGTLAVARLTVTIALHVVALTVVTLTVVALTVIALSVLALIFARLLLRARLLTGRLEIAEHVAFAVVAVAVAFVEAILTGVFALRTAIGIRLFVPRARLRQHAEIMIGELQMIFGQHTIAGLLCVARQSLVFFKQLRRVAARAIIDPVAVIDAALTATLPTAVRSLTAPAATATGLLTIVDQVDVILKP